MDKATSSIVTIYAESTPNPASMKFVADRMLVNTGSVEFLRKEDAGYSPLAQQLFGLDGITSVFIAANFITVTKKEDYEWFELIPRYREFIKEYLESGDPVFTGPSWQKTHEFPVGDSDDKEIEQQIINALDEYVRPAVEQDGGAIHFKSFNDGVVTLILKGSCSGCPSSIITLKAGIERLLTQLIPEVEEVIAE